MSTHNEQDYAPWVAKYELIAPYGKCQCGCGLDTSISSKNKPPKGVRKGDPHRYVWGHTGKQKVYSSLEDALFSNVEKGNVDDCWVWQGTQRGNGYGCVKYKGKILEAHRLSYEIHNGSIPDGLLVCHKCDNRPCVNPNHLFLGDHDDNHKDAKSKDRHTRGERQGRNKLRDADVIEIRRAYRTRVRGETIPMLAAQYGVCKRTIVSVARGKAWKHIESFSLESESCEPEKSRNK